MQGNGKVQSFHLRMWVTRAKILPETRLLPSPVRYKRAIKKRRRREEGGGEKY
jgi:hypothetical protein